MTEQEYAALMVIHSRLWPNFTPPEGTYTVWKPLLVDLGAQAVEAALHALAVEGREFAPNAGTIRSKAVELTQPRLPDADAALAEVWGQIHRVGHSGKPEFTHAAIGAAVEAMGGWSVCCASENPEAFRAQFRQLYGTASARIEREAVMPSSVRDLLASVDLSLDRALGDGQAREALRRGA